MANSTIKNDRVRRPTLGAFPGGGSKIFSSQLQGILKEKKKSEDLQNSLQQYNTELSPQNSDSSKETSNDLSARGKTYSTSCPRKSYNQISNPHQNDDAPDFIMRRSRRSTEHSMNASHNIKYHNFEKSHFDKNDRRNNPKDSFRKNQPNYKSDQHLKFQNNNFEPHYSSTEVQDNKQEKSVFNKLDFENQCEDENTETKHERLCSELDETIKDSGIKNIKVTIKPYNSYSSPNTSLISSSSLTSSVSNEPNSSVLSVSTLNTMSSPISPPSSISNISLVSSPISVLKANFDLPANIVLSNVFENPILNDNSVCILKASDDNSNFIPPPVSSISPSISENFSYSTETIENLFQNNGPEFSEVSSYADEVDLSLPDSEHLEAISKYILNIVKERSVSFTTAYKVVYDLNRLFKNHFEGNVIDYYGSYSTDLAITTSDINLTIQTEFSIRKSFMLEIYNILSKELERYHVLQCEEGSTAHKTKINFTHPDTGINCELAYLGRNKANILKMGKFLKEKCQHHHHVKPLIIAAKVWAEHFNINEVEDGKLHPIGFALLIIHFLQHCENPILPIYSCEEILENLLPNDSSIGALWLGFLKYYTSTFNWQEDVLTVTSRNKVSKKSKKWETYWIAIEDPFTGKNIAESVTNKDVADYIVSCFKETYNYFLNGPGIRPSSDNEDIPSGAESSSSELKFSFNDCIVERSEDICEACDEIDDVCEDCKKKIYVQPMASVPKMTDEFLKIVKKALSTVYDKYMLSDKEVNDRKDFVQKLERDVRRTYPDAQMRLFGSSANGFGFKNSDVDICLTFKSKEVYKPCAVLRDLRALLRKDKDFINVIAIFNATIPILKFRYKPRGWRGDISLDNVLASHNSELLYTYSLLDNRCKILGCALKLIAKKALIAEVTEKALSSYSYLIMVIHFLQQTDPPVLPILQDNKFRENNFELEDIIENCNVWFCRDVNYIKQKFKTTNNTPVEQLFLDLLDYYCSFDTTQLISIKQKEILPVPEGMPTARLFNIQDPFLVLKNLGRVVSPTKAQETKNVLNKARQLFRTPKKEPTDLESFFFSTMNLTGRYQIDTLCDFCGKFGHDQKDCRQSLSPFQKNNFVFNRYPRNKQYPNQNGFFKRNREANSR